MFAKATKQLSKLRMALSGPSGSGKTYSALRIGQGLGQRIAVIDTERGSASKYADLFDFDVCNLDNFSPSSYLEAIKAAGRAGYDVIIVDSLTHAWFWSLDQANGEKNSYTAWGKIRPLERALIDAILSSPAHVIVTMRTKTEYVMTTNSRGKPEPTKIGTAPIQSSGIEYEFDIAGEMDLNHLLTLSKSRCPDLSGTTHLNPGENLAATCLHWLGTAPPAKKISDPQTQLEGFYKAVNDALDSLQHSASPDDVIDKVLKYCEAMRKRIHQGEAPAEFSNLVKSKLREAMKMIEPYQPSDQEEVE